MNGKTSKSTQLQFERISNSCLSFRLKNFFISDNNYLFIVPQANFCRLCFQRRYRTQMITETRNSQISNQAITLAKKLDKQLEKNNLWQVYLVNTQVLAASFKFYPYEDCPNCAEEKQFDSNEVVTLYKNLLNEETIPELNLLMQQVFSFGFAVGRTTTQEIGLNNPEFNKLLAGNYEAKIIFRAVASDGRHADNSAIGCSTDKNLAELKALMEYLERYAFMLQLCHFKTKKYDDKIINSYLRLYRKKPSSMELTHIRDESCWGINLLTMESSAIPLSFLFNKGKISFIKPTSNGFGAHTSFKSSLCSSILELIERDAFVRFWHDPQRAFYFKPDENTQSEINNILKILKPVVDNETLVSRFFIIKSPTKIPVVIATISSQDFSIPPALAFGCGAGFDLNQALAGAIKELRFHVINLIKGVSVIDGFLTRKFMGKIEALPERMNFYSTSSPRKKLKFLDNDNPLTDGIMEATSTPDLDSLIDRFKKINFDIYGIDCTPRCFQDKNVFVTRAFSPQLYPIQFEEEDVFNITVGKLSAHKKIPHFFT